LSLSIYIYFDLRLETKMQKLMPSKIKCSFSNFQTNVGQLEHAFLDITNYYIFKTDLGCIPLKTLRKLNCRLI